MIKKRVRNSEVSSECKTHSRQSDYSGLLFLQTSAEYIVTNDLSNKSTDDVEFEIQTRWKIEEFHARIKQLTGLEFWIGSSGKNPKKSYCLCHVSLELFEKNGKNFRDNYLSSETSIIIQI